MAWTVVTGLARRSWHLDSAPATQRSLRRKSARNHLLLFSFTTADARVPAIDCGSFQVLENFVINIDVKRRYDEVGNIVSAEHHLPQPVSGSDNIWYNPLNLKSVPQVGDWNARFDFVTPGDTSAFVETDTGAGSRALLPGGQVLIMEAGRIIFGPPPDFTIQFVAGPHRIESRDVTRVCAALN